MMLAPMLLARMERQTSRPTKAAQTKFHTSSPKFHVQFIKSSIFNLSLNRRISPRSFDFLRCCLIEITFNL